MGQRRIKKQRRRFINLPDWDSESLAKEYLLSFRVVSEDPEDLVPASALLFKYATLENARFLARLKNGHYEFLLTFLTDQEKGRARENIRAAFETDEADVSPIQSADAPDLAGWQPFGRVLPKHVSDGVVFLMSRDRDLIESTHLAMLKRQETDPDGDYVFPNMPEEVAEAWRKFRDRTKQ